MNDWVHALTRPAKSLGLFPNLLACHISWMPAEEVGLLDQRQDIGAHSKAGSRQPAAWASSFQGGKNKPDKILSDQEGESSDWC